MIQCFVLGVIGILVTDMLCGMVYTASHGKYFRWLYHDVSKWHICDVVSECGFQLAGKCVICGKRCLQDSQGNWFEASVQEDGKHD